MFGNLFSNIGKMFSGKGDSSWGSSAPGSFGSYFQNFPGGLLDNIMGKGFYNGGGLIGQLFGGGGGGGGGGDVFGSLGGSGLYAKGGVFAPGAALAHFENQIIERPTMFRFAAGGALGLMGEAGPEAVMPLRRGADGKLGVAAQHGGGANVVFNIQTPNADSFRASQSQINSKAVAHLQTSSMRNATH